jgi:small-conductance mechanosensitive channel
MDFVWYQNTLQQWLVALAAMSVILSTLMFARHLIAVRWSALVTRTQNHIDDLVVSVARGTRTWFLTALAVTASSELLQLNEPSTRWLRAVAVVAIVVQAALWGNVVITHLVATHLERRGAADGGSAAGALGFVARLALWSVLLILGLDNLGIDITALVAGLGVGGVAVALAVQNILGDLFASLSIVLDKPFVPGDFVIVGDLMGTVEHVGLKTTRVRSLHGEQIVFSNADLLNSRIRNYKRMEERRVVFSVGVTYDTPRAKLELIPTMVRAIIERLPDVRLDRVHFKAFGAFSLDFEIVYYMLSPDYNQYMDMQHTINLAIVDAFAEAEIEFAFPTQTLHLSLPKREDNARMQEVAL